MENKEFDNKIKYLKDIYDTNEKSHNIMLNNMQMSVIRLEELENKKMQVRNYLDAMGMRGISLLFLKQKYIQLSYI